MNKEIIKEFEKELRLTIDWCCMMLKPKRGDGTERQTGELRDEIVKCVSKKAFEKALKSQNQELLERYKKAFFQVMNKSCEITSNKAIETMKGNSGVWEIKKEDWQDCSFTFEGLWEDIKKLIK